MVLFKAVSDMINGAVFRAKKEDLVPNGNKRFISKP